MHPELCNSSNYIIILISIFVLIFISPFEKWTYYAVAMSVRPSIRPSVRCWKMNGRSKVLLENQMYWRQLTGLDGNYWPRKITARRWLHKYVGAECGASSFTWYIYQMCKAPCHWKVFWAFFLHVLRYELEIWYTHPVGGTTHQVWISSQSGLCLWRVFQTFSKCFEVPIWKLVYTLSRLYNILSSHFTRMGSLWPNLCS